MLREALVIGITQYGCDDLENFSTPARDARAIAKLLRTYGDFHVTELVSRRERITAAVVEEAIALEITLSLSPFHQTTPTPLQSLVIHPIAHPPSRATCSYVKNGTAGCFCRQLTQSNPPMNNTDFSRHIPVKILAADIESLRGLSTIDNYNPIRDTATPQALQTAYSTMQAKQQKETELTATLKAASDAARQAEVSFHDATLAMKESVRGQFGPNSDEAQAIGYKKKSEYKRPRRRSA